MKEELWNILNKTIDWVKYSDTKAVFILTFYGVIFTILYTNASDVYEFVQKDCVTITLTILTVISALVSTYCSFIAINPRLKNNNPTSIIYFGHICKKFNSYDEYKKDFKIKFNNENEYINQLSEQIYINSQIAWKKFENVTYSIRFLFSSVILMLINIIIYFLK